MTWSVARKGDAPLSQIAKDFGISEACRHRWLKIADVDDGIRPGVMTQESADLRGSVCGMQPRRASGADEERLWLLGLADPAHLDDDYAFAADVGQVDEHQRASLDGARPGACL